MRRYLGILLIVLICFSCNKNNYELIGSIEGVEDGSMLYIKTIDKELRIKVDSTIITNGIFSLSGNIENPDVHLIVIDGVRGNLPFILENTDLEFILYKDSLGLSIIKGSEENDLATSYKSTMETYRKKSNHLFRQYTEARQQNDSAFIKNYNDLKSVIFDDARAFNKDFALENKNSVFGILLMEKLIKLRAISTKEGDSIIKTTSKYIQNTKAVKRIREHLGDSINN